MIRRAFPRAALVIVVGVAAWTGTALAASVEGHTASRGILFVNDSVTNFSVGSIINEFNDYRVSGRATRYAPTFGASLGGSGLRQVPGVQSVYVPSYWRTLLQSLMLHAKPETIVVELGYNDCTYDPAGEPAQIDNFMGALTPGIPVYWLTLHDVNGVRTCDETINAQLAAATARWPQLRLLDFRSFMAGHPEWLADNTHPNLAGQRAYAKWLHGQLDTIYG